MILSQHGIIQSIKRGGGIVTDGLVMHLDAGNAASYPGSGTTWTDLSGNGKNATLVNGVSYSSDNGGVLTLDGVDDYMSLDSTLSVATNAPFSIELCFYITSFANTYPNLIQLKTNTSYSYQISFTSFAPPNGYSGVIFGATSGDSWKRINTLEQLIENTWNHIVLTYSGSGSDNINSYNFYRNNINYVSLGNANDFGATGQFNHIGTIDANRFFFNGKLPIARIYNRALSAAEVEQNFNVTKGRYGL
jgi:hypothetical protein